MMTGGGRWSGKGVGYENEGERGSRRDEQPKTKVSPRDTALLLYQRTKGNSMSKPEAMKSVPLRAPSGALSHGLL